MTTQRSHHGIQIGTMAGLLAMVLAVSALAASASERVSPDYGKLPLSFEANWGQTDEQVKFLSRGTGYAIFLTSSQAVLSLRKTDGEKITQDVVRMTAVGANPAAAMTALDELPGKSNYFIGNDPPLWRTGVPSYSRVRYHEVYPGIDLVFYGNQRQLEYDFIVAPAADPNRIRLAFDGVQRLRIDEQGDLVLEVAGSELRQHRPVVYQEALRGVREAVSGRFVLKGQNEVAFLVDPYDPTRPLVIDPSLSYSTYLGGSDLDIGRAIAVDSMGFAYVTGETLSADFPKPPGGPFPCSGFGNCSNGGKDIFVAKVNQTGTALVYSSYVGHGGDDVGSAIAVDSSGNAYVAGSTTSPSFPIMNGWDPNYAAFNDGVFFKLNATGDALLYSTLIGGTGDDVAFGIALDSSNNAWVTGQVNSLAAPAIGGLEPFPATFTPYLGDLVPGGSPATDAFVAKFNPSAAGAASLLYFTYLGGSDTDIGRAIAVDSSGAAYVTGSTRSISFPSTPGTIQPTKPNVTASDAFVSKIDPGALPSHLVYSTYLASSTGTPDDGRAVALTASHVYVAGTSQGSFPTQSGVPVAAVNSFAGGAFPDAFVTKLPLALNSIAYTTFVGGSGQEQGMAMRVDDSGNAYIGGFTSSTPTSSVPFPLLNAIQTTFGGVFDVFVTKLDSTGARVYSTYLGGGGNDQAFGLAVQPPSNVFITGQTLSTGLTPFPTTAGVLQGTYAGGAGFDAFVAKMVETVNQPPVANAGLDQTIECASSAGTAVTLNGGGSSDPDGDPITLTWTGPFPTSPVTGTGPTITLPLGTHVITLTVSDGQLSTVDTVQITVQDTTAPSLSLTLNPTAIPPPADGRMVSIAATATGSDACSTPTIVLQSITAGQLLVPGVDYQNANFAINDPSFDLKATKDTGSSGRTYTIAYRATDGQGLTKDATGQVTVGNTAPTANAGVNQTLQCTGPAPTCRVVTLNGTGSSDPDGDPLTYTWTWSGGTLTGATPTVTLPSLGAHTFTLVVNDGQVDSAPSAITITVVDTTAPDLTLTATPDVITPPNGRMWDILVTAVVTDTCDPTPTVTLDSITANEPLEEGEIQGAVLGTADFNFQLRAKRSGGISRIYTIKYKAVDASGNIKYQTTTVTVPHNQSN